MRSNIAVGKAMMQRAPADEVPRAKHHNAAAPGLQQAAHARAGARAPIRCKRIRAVAPGDAAMSCTATVDT
jgi:hypothetical protein